MIKAVQRTGTFEEWEELLATGVRNPGQLPDIFGIDEAETREVASRFPADKNSLFR